METKTCTKCGVEKQITEFNWAKKGVSREGRCRECLKAYHGEHYKKNKTTYQKNQRQYRKTQRGKKKEKERFDGVKRMLVRWLSKHPCIACGEDNPVVLETHHRNPDEKNASIGTLVGAGRNWEFIKTELAKCDVLCANCHKREHFAIIDGIRRKI